MLHEHRSHPVKRVSSSGFAKVGFFCLATKFDANSEAEAEEHEKDNAQHFSFTN